MFISSALNDSYHAHTAAVAPHLLARRAEPHDHVFVVLACLIPVLVILSGIFAGLTLGYMSLDETQLNVLATSGTPLQREYANKIIPVRKNGHLLLVTLLLANMVVNETLPVVSDRVLGGGVPAVAVSTVLIVIFAEIIPQSICTRHGLYIGAKCAILVQMMIYALAIVAWPVAKLLEMTLGPHHGIIYRRAELKELINMHSSVSPHGGDLKHDTVTIIGATLDLQEKVVRDAMTPIADVFMLPIDARLDYETLRRVCESGHSRVPVYDEVEVVGNKRAKKIVGILLVKQCVLLDPKDATPLRSIPLNKVPSVPFDEPLLGILDRFQEGRSHMAIVSLFSKGRAASVKDAVKTGLTRRFLNRVGLREDENETELELYKGRVSDSEAGVGGHKERATGLLFPAGVGIEGREQSMPADAVLASEDAENFLRGVDLEVNPLGIITLEDVLEELIGEEILDEFDLTGPQAAARYVPPSASRAAEEQSRRAHLSAGIHAPTPLPAAVLRGTGVLQFPRVSNIFYRSRSQPGTPRPPGDNNTPARTPPVGDDADGTDANTLHPTLTLDTDTTTALQLDDGLTPPPVVLDLPPLAAAGATAAALPRRSASVTPPPLLLNPPTPTSTTAPRVTEAILQTQNARRRALAQASATSHGPLVAAASAAGGGGELLAPPRAGAKGRFKSSPLMPAATAAAAKTSEEKAAAPEKEKEKVAESDPQLDEPKEGL